MYEERIANAIAELIVMLPSELLAGRIDRADVLEAVVKHIRELRRGLLSSAREAVDFLETTADHLAGKKEEVASKDDALEAILAHIRKIYEESKKP